MLGDFLPDLKSVNAPGGCQGWNSLLTPSPAAPNWAQSARPAAAATPPASVCVGLPGVFLSEGV